jgi:indole-3-glycerol phosphate synthase
MSELYRGPLSYLYEASEAEALRSEEHEPIYALEKTIENRQYQLPSLIDAINGDPNVSVIAEHKRKSPSEGDIKADSGAALQAEFYKAGGATALSILTQEEYFGGNIIDVEVASSWARLPVLRKDFISNEYQVYQAAAYGASAILLIVAGLPKGNLDRLYDEAKSVGIECLFEAHTESEAKQALQSGAKLIGINNRDLVTMKTDTKTFEELREFVPDEIPVVAESGYRVSQPDHIRQLRELGASAVLIGTDLMKSVDPSGDLQRWLATK